MTRPDLEPGFWPEYQPPATYVGAAVQFPMDDKWADRVMTAYALDVVATRRRSRETKCPTP
jgi:hypothetical protein